VGDLNFQVPYTKTFKGMQQQIQQQMMNVTGNSFKPNKQGSPPPQSFDHQKMIMESLI
jgi:hypothetical protein